MADLSTDIKETVGFWSFSDFRADMPVVRGREALLHRLCVRLQTVRGRFSGTNADGTTWGWPNFGTDLSQFLLSKATPQQIANAARSECLKDEQVADCLVFAEIQDSGKRIKLAIRVVDSAGPWIFTIQIDQARLTLIDLQAA